MTEERDGGNIALHIRRQIFEIGLLIENSISRLTLVSPFRSATKPLFRFSFSLPLSPAKRFLFILGNKRENTIADR